MNSSPDNNPLPEPASRFTQEAQQLVGELNKMIGKKALILIVDDLPLKRQSTLDIFRVQATQSTVGFAFSSKASGEETVGLYEAFRREDSTENPIPVILVMDSTLARPTDPTPYKTGGDVATRILKISDSNGWKRPYLVGNAMDDTKHKYWEELFPDNYIAGYVIDSAPVFDAIEAKL